MGGWALSHGSRTPTARRGSPSYRVDLPPSGRRTPAGWGRSPDSPNCAASTRRTTGSRCGWRSPRAASAADRERGHRSALRLVQNPVRTHNHAGTESRNYRGSARRPARGAHGAQRAERSQVKRVVMGAAVTPVERGAEEGSAQSGGGGLERRRRLSPLDEPSCSQPIRTALSVLLGTGSTPTLRSQ